MSYSHIIEHYPTDPQKMFIADSNGNLLVTSELTLQKLTVSNNANAKETITGPTIVKLLRGTETNSIATNTTSINTINDTTIPTVRGQLTATTNSIAALKAIVDAL
jgi:hypothetical protein